MSSAALRPRADERWLAGTSPVERLSATMALFVLVSVAIHAAMVATTLVGARPAPPPRQEITVEIVREVPRETPAAKPAAAKTETAKAEPAKPEPAKLALPNSGSPKSEPPKSEPPKSEPPKSEPAKQDPPKAEAEKAPPPAPPAKAEQASEPPKPQAAPPKPPAAPPAPPVDAAAEAQKAATIKAMEREIASLKAQQAALQAENAAAERAAASAAAAEARPVALRDTGLGPLPESFQAVALPAAADGAGEAVDYREIVFSALAKAKAIGGQMGLPGSAGVHFEIDATGKLIGVELVHPSGVAALDAQALAIVRKAAPFPPPPQGAQRSFDANVNFVTASGR